jgi:hypothetical protein
MTDIPGVNPQVLRRAVDASSASLPHHPDGGSTCVAVPTAAMSAAAAHHRANTRVHITGTADTGIPRASSRPKTATGTSPRTTTPTAHSWHRPHHPQDQPVPEQAGASPPTGRNDCIADQTRVTMTTSLS